MRQSNKMDCLKLIFSYIWTYLSELAGTLEKSEIKYRQRVLEMAHMVCIIGVGI